MRVAPARYELVRVLGRGSSFAVALCRIERAPVIVKREVTSAGAIDRERWALEKLSGAHSPALIEAGRDEEGAFVAEAVAGGLPLRAWLERHRGDRRALVGAALSLVEAIGAVHARGVVHADVAPANTWLDGPEGTVTFIDFGASGDALGGPPEPLGRGTLPWIPPELAREEARPSRESDRYGIAALAAHVLTGEPLLEATTEPSQLYAIGASGLSMDRLRRALDRSGIEDFPEAVTEALVGALAFEPRRRSPSLDELSGALASFRTRISASPS